MLLSSRVPAVVLATLAACCGCGHRTWHFASVSDASVSLPAMTTPEAADRRAGHPPEPLAITRGGDRTVLIACQTHDNPQRDLDDWGRAFVIVLTGPIARGKVEITPENGRFILHEALRPARRPYVGLDGSIDIWSVGNGRIVAYCGLRARMQDAYGRTYVLRGLYEFRTATGAEPFLRGGGIELQ